MIETTVGELRPRDEFKAGERGRTYIVSSTWSDRDDPNLRAVYAEGYDKAVMVTTPETRVWATVMVREVEVSCLALTHPGEEPARMLHDLAKGPQPRGIFCGDCAAAADEQATIEP